MTAAQALASPSTMRELCYQAKADRRVVTAVLRGMENAKRPSSTRERIRVTMAALGIDAPSTSVRAAAAVEDPAPALRPPCARPAPAAPPPAVVAPAPARAIHADRARCHVTVVEVDEHGSPVAA